MDFVLTLFKILIVVGILQLAVAYMIYLERKVSAYLQGRIGPNRVGWHGLLQPIADAVKLVLKEDLIPAGANKVLYVLAPAIAVFTTMIGFAVVPFGPTNPNDPAAAQFVIAPRIDIGILYVLAVGSLAVYAVILGGWASNNKYSFLGAMRSSAQLISYEIPLGLSIIGVVLIAGSLNLERIIDAQADGVWFVVCQPVAFLVFFISALAESGRLPFDLPECEQELIGGYHTEYSAMKWAMFFFGEYTHIITVSLLTVILFFGGWDLPRVLGVTYTVKEPGATSFQQGERISRAEYEGAVAQGDQGAFEAERRDGFFAGTAKIFVLLVKAFTVILVIMWIRWTLPRFRFDQLMGLAWKVLIPVALVNLLLTAAAVQFFWSEM